MNRYYFKESIERFLEEDTSGILGRIVQENPFDLNFQQRDSWVYQTELLKETSLIGLALLGMRIFVMQKNLGNLLNLRRFQINL